MPMRKNGILFLATLILLVLIPGFVRAQAADNANNFDGLAARASAAREAGQREEAIRNYREALVLNPKWDEGWWYLGTLSYDADHFAEAARALQNVVALDPQLGAAWAFLGLSEFETRNYGDAFQHLQRAHDLGLADDPAVARVAWYHLALLLNLNGEFERCSELLAAEFGQSHFPDQVKVALGIALLRIPLLPTQTDPARDALIHDAGDTAALLANHETEQALQSFRQMLERYPGTPYLAYAYGEVLASVSRFQESEQFLRQETRLTPGSALPWIALASLSLQQHKHEDALREARRAVEIEPHSRSAYNVLSSALREAGRAAPSSEAAEKARQFAQEPVEIDASQAARYALTHSAGAVTSTYADSPTQTHAEFDDLASRAEAALKAGNNQEAISAYESALKLRQGWGDGWRSLGTLDYMENRYPDAIASLQHAVTLEPKQADAWTILGLSEFQTKDYANSLIHLQRGSDLGFGGNRPAVQFAKDHMALLLNRNGEFDQALRLLVPDVAAGDPTEETKFAMGLALLRINKLPEQIDAATRPLVRSAGQAAVFLSESHYDQAFPIFETMLQAYPQTPYLHFAYGSALASTSNYEQAQAQLREEIRINPGSALPYTRLAAINLQLHQPQNAIEFAKKAMSIAPDSAEPHYILGRSLLEVGDTAGAVKELEIARQLAPTNPAVHFNLARAYTKAQRSAEAEQERAEFERLNDQMQQQQKQPGTSADNALHSNDRVPGDEAPQSVSK